MTKLWSNEQHQIFIGNVEEEMALVHRNAMTVLNLLFQIVSQRVHIFLISGIILIDEVCVPSYILQFNSCHSLTPFLFGVV